MGRNWDFSKTKGRDDRLNAELTAFQGGESVPSSPPLHSHDGTMQHFYNQSWNGVSAIDIQQHCHPKKSIALSSNRLSMLRSLRQCHLH
ncbi:hypothetical protein C9J12_08245 [Photobacterium frigidiphilum]|uniref:Uncharacterized protein n=1 Tax=Photobacterium frigidiphilum TaxID=264736 RepID=A0A2T3JKE2_9GAMM|nr:hypothetical protein [Photobacterium frigidiphilum]PSU49469.1 hypothetical protein C9J12_08245 [Photobacterium frigidiphilum]